MSITVTQSELWAAIDRAAELVGYVQKPPGFFTVEEYIARRLEKAGEIISRNTAYTQLMRKVNEGKLEKVVINPRKVCFGEPRRKPVESRGSRKQ